MSISMHREPITAGTDTHTHTHTHADTTSWPSPSDEPKFALPMVLCARAISQPRRFPLNSHNFIKEEWEEQGGAEEKKKQKKKREKRERKSSVFLITSPWGFQLRRWGRSKQFCLSCFCCVALSFRGRFCFKLSFSLSLSLFFFFLLRNRGGD